MPQEKAVRVMAPKLNHLSSMCEISNQLLPLPEIIIFPTTQKIHLSTADVIKLFSELHCKVVYSYHPPNSFPKPGPQHDVPGITIL